MIHTADTDTEVQGSPRPLQIEVQGVELLGPPGPPLEVSAAAGTGEVVLSWSEPGSLGHRAVIKYQVRHKKTSDGGFGNWSDVADSGDDGMADERSVTVSGLDTAVEYTLQVRAVNSEGDGTEAEVMGTTHSAPSFSDVDYPSDAVSRSVEENTTSGDVGAAITATDADGDTLAYSVAATTETDATDNLADFNRDFELDTATGQISVRAGAMIDFETRSSYVVSYQVTDNKNTAGDADTAIDDTLTLTVDVTNVDEAGAVSFGADPAVGTALTATLTDPDTVSGSPTWQWQRSKRPDTGFTDISSATSAIYTPLPADNAYFLRAAVSYTDGSGPGRSAVGVTGHPVGVPRRLLVKNTGVANGNYATTANSILYKLFGTGDSPAGYQLDRIQVRLRRNDGDPVTAQLYRRQQDTAGVGGHFVDLAPENPSTNLNAVGNHWLVPPAGTVLEPGTNYFIRLARAASYRAAIPVGAGSENSGGASGWRISSNTVIHDPNDIFDRGDDYALLIIVEGVELLGPPGPPLSVSGAPGNSEVVLSWSEPGSLGHRAVSKYQVRHKKTSDASFGGWADVADSDGDMDMADERSVTVSGLEGGVEYTLQVRAVNSEGDGTGAEARAAPTSAPSFSDTEYPGAAVTRTVEENTTTGDVGDAITATDADGDTLTYSVAATTGGEADLTAFNQHFTLNTATGQISVRAGAMIDYETRSSYVVSYQVTDGEDSSGSTETGTPTIDDTLTLTVNVDDVEVENFLTISDATVAEPVSGSADATFTVWLSPALPAGSSPATVLWSTAVGSDAAIHWADDDFTAVDATALTFNAGETSKTVSVTLLGDSIDEWDEEFLLQLESADPPLGFADGEKELAATVTIVDSDVPVASIAADAEASEGDPLTFRIDLDIASSRDLEVEYFTPSRSSFTADATDYTMVPPSAKAKALVPAGSTSASVHVQTTEDTDAEVDETFLVVVEAVILASSDPAAPRVVVGNNAAVGGGRAGTILDDEPRVVIDASASTAEDTSGGAAVPVRLVDRDGNATTSAETVTVTFSTAADRGAAQAATAGASTNAARDYTSVSGGSATIAAGQSSGTASVSLHDDALDEYDETFAVRVTSVSANAHRGGFESGSALHSSVMVSSVVTITDDDPLPVVSVADRAAAEGTNLAFTVSLDEVSGRNVAVQYTTEAHSGAAHPATAGGSSDSSRDFTTKSGTVTVTAGRQSATVTVATFEDALDEYDETMKLRLTGAQDSANNTVGEISSANDGTATGTIIDDDPLPSVSIDNTETSEAGDLTFTVRLGAVSGRDVAVQHETRIPGSRQGALRPVEAADFGAVAGGEVMIAEGRRTAAVTVGVTGDSLDEWREFVLLCITGGAGTPTWSRWALRWGPTRVRAALIRRGRAASSSTMTTRR